VAPRSPGRKPRRGIREALALDGPGVGVNDLDAGVCSQERNEPSPERPRDGRRVVRKDRERGVEPVASVRPLAERRGEQYHQSAAIDGSDDPSECVGRASIVGVEHGRPGRRTEQRLRPVRSHALDRENVALADENRLPPIDPARGEDGRRALVTRLARPVEYHQAALVRPACLRAEVTNERDEGHIVFGLPGFMSPTVDRRPPTLAIRRPVLAIDSRYATVNRRSRPTIRRFRRRSFLWSRRRPWV
jgi:hypothetical protein